MSVMELTLVTGQSFLVSGSREQVEKTILAAARGSLMQLAWLEEAETARPLGINPAHVVALHAAGSLEA